MFRLIVFLSRPCSARALLITATTLFCHFSLLRTRMTTDGRHRAASPTAVAMPWKDDLIGTAHILMYPAESLLT
ncbi:hypothetical protein A7A09_011410 [Paracoccus methylarcula]|uniref:Uncharacterized protein n=1 Tax=Paracoccus methylarcula TaxID=72022 RepID=A0A3R7LK02_9RHOB|nr:hypothetical protein A7A09_011410 [Paracoccus methylarcula]